MGIRIEDPVVETLAHDLARRHGIGVTEVIHRALAEKAQRDGAAPTLWEKLRPLREELARMGKTGLQADRGFYDDLSGEEP